MPATASQLRSQRLVLLVGAVVYLSWWFVVEKVLPGAYNPLSSRLAVVAAFLAVLGASYASAAVRRRIELGVTACVWLLTLHYYVLLHENGGTMPWAVGAYVVVVAAGACLSSRRALLAYSLWTVTLGVGVAMIDRALLATIFLPGLLTMTLLSNFSLRNRLLLEDERAERVRTEVARAAAQAAIDQRDEFITVASHELRTPLTALQLAVQTLARVAQKGDRTVPAERLERALAQSQRQVERLTRLVDALLDASRIPVSGILLRKEPLALDVLVRDAVQTLSAGASSSTPAIEVDGATAVTGFWDRVRLEQVVMNLLRNAVTFGLGRPISVTLSASADRATLTVKDRGIGIEPSAHARIFGRFERAVPSHNYGGLGLGLYVVDQIVRAHGGAVRVESAPGEGATFVVDLPRDA